MMNVKVLFFGITTDFVGESEMIVSLENRATVDDLKSLLNHKYPKLNNLNSYAIAVNEVYANNNDVLKDNDVVAIIPPVSGG